MAEVPALDENRCSGVSAVHELERAGNEWEDSGNTGSMETDKRAPEQADAHRADPSSVVGTQCCISASQQVTSARA